MPFYLFRFLFGMDFIFEWLDAEHIAHDPLIQKNSTYLNLPFFVVRNIIYFIIFSAVSSYYWKLSIRQDNSTKEEANNITKNATSLFTINTSHGTSNVFCFI